MIICYMGGTCGDLISAMIDPTDVIIENSKITLTDERQRLKKSYLFSSDHRRDQYLEDISKIYKSIPSHDLEYHIRNKHEFIGITVTTFDTAMWAACRFKNIHSNTVWQDMQNACGADTIEKYAQMMIDYSNMILQYTQKIITLESIRQGHVAINLASYINGPVDEEIYHTWLAAQTKLREND